MDKYAIVTGGNRGIGLEITKKLSDKGIKVAVLGRKINDKLQALMESKKDIKFFSVDIGSLDSINSVIPKILEEFPYVDLLVNNAGVAPAERLDLLEVEETAFDFLMDINLKGTFFMSQKISKIMISQNRDIIPKIINISSISAYTSSINRGEYCISKAGISMITKLFAHRLAEENILVYEVRPGIIKTDMTKKVSEEYDKKIEDGLLPIKRWGYGTDVANVVYALSLPEFSYSTGDVINVDGGFHIRRL